MIPRNALKKIDLDAVFTKRFYEMPERDKDIDELMAQITFPLPASAEVLADFFASEDGARFRSGFIELFVMLGQWLSKYIASDGAINAAITNLKRNYVDYPGDDNGLNTTYFPTYRQAAPYLKGVLHLLANSAIPLDVKKKQVIEIFAATYKCFPGLYTRTYDAYTEMMSYLGVKEDFHAYRSAVARTVAIDMIRNLNDTQLAVYPGDEIHYANRVLTDYSDQLCILVNEDTLSRGHPLKVQALLELYAPAISAALSLGSLLLFLITKLQLDEAFEKACIAMQDGRWAEYNDVASDLKAAVNRYGQGDLDMARLFVLASDSASLKCISVEAESYLCISLIERLINSGYIDNKCFLIQEFESDEGVPYWIRYLPDQSLKYASVHSGDECVPFFDYYVKQIELGRLHKKIITLIACKPDSYKDELVTYLIGYLNQYEYDDADILPENICRLVGALAGLTLNSFEDVANRLIGEPAYIIRAYLARILMREFPTRSNGTLYNDIMKVYFNTDQLSGLQFIKAVMGYRVNMQSSVNQYGTTLLHLVSKHGTGDVLSLVMHTVSGFGCRDKNGVTPFMLACHEGNLSVVSEILKLRPQLACEGEELGLTPLHYAAINSNKEVLMALIAAGADVNAKDIGGMTPLHISCTNGHIDNIRILINNGANVNAVHDDGTSVLDAGCVSGNYVICNILIDAGARIDPDSRYFDRLFKMLCYEHPSRLSKRILIHAVQHYLKESDARVNRGKYSCYDITQTNEQNFKLFGFKMNRRYAKSRVADILLRKLTNRADEDDGRLWQSENERMMHEWAYMQSKKLRRLLSLYEKLNAYGYLDDVKRHKPSLKN